VIYGTSAANDGKNIPEQTTMAVDAEGYEKPSGETETGCRASV
jgi:hypothetical protein